MVATSKIEFSSIISHNPEQVSCDLDGETVLMSIENGMYYGMNMVASRIWELVTESKSVKELYELLLQEYEVEEKQCEKEVFQLLSQLQEEGLIQVAST